MTATFDSPNRGRQFYKEYEGVKDQYTMSNNYEEDYEEEDEDEDHDVIGDEDWTYYESDFYNCAWALFASDPERKKLLTYTEIPWPTPSRSSSKILEVILYGFEEAEERKSRLRSEILKWHPDKFKARMHGRLTPKDTPEIMEKALQIYEALRKASKQP